MRNTTAAPGVWAGQGLHLVALVVLLGLTWVTWNMQNRPHPAAFWIAVAVPVAHQIFVWLVWRFRLRSPLPTTGVAAFRSYLVVFFILFGSRFVTLGILAWLDRGSLGLPPLLQAILAIALALPGL